MIGYVGRRLSSAIVVLAIASVGIFLLLRLIPGNPAVILAGSDPSPATIAAIEQELGLNEPLPAQYLKWLSGILTGDLGRSYILGAPIGLLVGNSLANTAELTIAALILALLVGFAVGIYGALARSKLAQTAVTMFTTLGFAVPTYTTGVLLVLVFAVYFRVLPPGGNPIGLFSDPEIAIQYLILPTLTLALPISAVIARFLMTALRESIQEDYVRTARAKGLKSRVVVVRHALPNALPPVITVVGILTGQLLGGALIVESIFAWPGVGRLMLDSVLRHDYLVVQALLLLAVAVFLVLQLITDVIYATLDPRVRLGS